MKTVVTGAAGFIGSHLVEFLVSRGDEVCAIDRRPVMPSAAVGLQADLCDPAFRERLHEETGRADAVFHLAGCPGVRDNGPAVHMRRRRDNVLAAEVVLNAVPADIPLVVTSSSSVYGGSLRRGVLRPSREDDRPRPAGGYAASKLQMEALCRRRAAAGGLVAVARPFTVAGERQRPDMAIASWIEAGHAGRPIRIFGSPSRSRDITDVRDVVTALVLMADRRVTGTLNLGTGRAWSLMEITDTVSLVLGRPLSLAIVPAGKQEVAATVADTTRCTRLLAFTLSTDLVSLVERQAAALEPRPNTASALL